jgi:2'-5' RNA ligase
MDEQFSLPGFDPEPAPAATPKTKPKASKEPSKKKSNATDRLFFAVLPDADAIAAIRQCTTQLWSRHRLSGQLIIDGRLHISLLGLDDFPGEEVQEVTAVVSPAAAMISLPAFDVCFDRALTFGNQKAEPAKRKPWVLVESTASQGLPALQSALFAALLARKAPSGFTPHLTLLYDWQRLPATDVVPITWKVREFVLVRSKIGNTSRPYDILARWPLSDPSDLPHS